MRVTTYDVLPAAAKEHVDRMAAAIGYDQNTVTQAILAWEALSGLTEDERTKALAILVRLAMREVKP